MGDGSVSILRLEKRLNKYLAEKQSGLREGSIVSVQTLESVRSDPTAWKEIMRDLAEVGITSEMVREHRQYIVDWIKIAIETGALNEGATEPVIAARPTPGAVEVLASPVRSTLVEKRSKPSLTSTGSEKEPSVLGGIRRVDTEATLVGDVDRPPLAHSTSAMAGIRCIDTDVTLVPSMLERASSMTSRPGTAMSVDGASPSRPKADFKSLYQKICGGAKNRGPQVKRITEEDSPSTYEDFDKPLSKQYPRTVSPDDLDWSEFWPSPGKTGKKVVDPSSPLLRKTSYPTPPLSRKASFSSFKKPSNPYGKEEPRLVTDLKSTLELTKDALDFKKHRKVLVVETERELQCQNVPSPKLGDLHWAALQGSLDRIRRLLDEGVDVDTPTERGFTALHYAAQQGYLEIVQYLLDRGAFIDSQNLDERTPLHLAADADSDDIVLLLLRRRADPNIATKSGSRLIHILAKRGRTRALHELIGVYDGRQNAKDYDGNTALHEACRSGQDEIVQILFDQSNLNNGLGLSENHWTRALDMKNSYGHTPLHLCAGAGSLKATKLMLEDVKKKDLQTRLWAGDRENRRPFHHAVQLGQGKVVDYMLKLSAKHDCEIERLPTATGFTPLHLAVRSKHLHVVERLLTCRGVDVNLETARGSGITPLSLAMGLNEPGLVKLLMANGATCPASTKNKLRPALAWENGKEKKALPLTPWESERAFVV